MRARRKAMLASAILLAREAVALSEKIAAVKNL
jgi:hypothetical protein